MRFATRTFLWSFIPFALLLAGSFWNVQKLAQQTVRAGIRSSLRRTHESMGRVRAKDEARNIRFLRIVGDNASLKAGLQLMISEPGDREAQLTVEDQLREMSETMGIDLLAISDSEGHPLAGVTREGGQVTAMDRAAIPATSRRFLLAEGQAYEIASTPINQGDENLGMLSLGERFDLSDFSTPAVLMRGSEVVASSVSGIPSTEVAAALRNCPAKGECDLRLSRGTYLSLPIESTFLGDGFQLRSLQSVDSETGPVLAVLRSLFFVTGIGTLLATVIIAMISSRGIVRPIAGVISHLRETHTTGLLPEFRPHGKLKPIQEIRELMESFNQAAQAVREGRDNLHRAYVEFVGSLANALDARDPYTAGHSERVSELSCLIARAMGAEGPELEEIRIGALLHDIGKIGIADSVLQKDGRLTEEERLLIQQHPTIGRRILEGVGGFQPYLATVELHHENWDGSGYPRGLAGEASPLPARIVHVADAYDAMTSNRPYRRAMSHEQAIRILQQNSGTQFDAAIVPVFVQALDRGTANDSTASIQNLSLAVGSGDPRVPEEASRV
ncbi:MAG TPA: HD-GYP domain-containing protein [Bryobacteraceae bacterium]|nr:HD-GYP domain-containing protein [Bryobacteraceae bacterium]